MTTETFREYLDRLMVFTRSAPERMNARLGLEVLDCSAGDAPSVRFLYCSREEFTNPYGGVHGGIVCTLADTCAGFGLVALTDQLVTTTDISVSFLRALTGKRYEITVDYTHMGQRLCSGNIRIADADTGELCATAMATYMILGDRPPGMRI